MCRTNRVFTVCRPRQVLTSEAPPRSTATPEELVRATRHMTSATARAVSAAGTHDQDQLVAAANLGRKTVLDLLHACKVYLTTKLIILYHSQN